MTGKELLLESMDTGDPVNVLNALKEMQTMVSTDDELVSWVIAPPNITMLHNRLVDEFGVNQRAMRLRHRVSNNKKRAVMFLKAMENGVSKVI